MVENEVTGTFAPNGFIRINPTGAVTLVMPMVEMGQGVYTALSMLLAEELEVELDQIQVQHAPPNDALYANSFLRIQTTGASSSVRAFWTPLRQAGAVGRNLLIAAAAKRWSVDPATCRAKNGVVFNASGSKHLSYGELAKAAAKLPVPPAANVKLKDPKDFTLIGTRAKRVDSSIKVDGRALYGIDTRLPGMKVAAVAISPVLGGKAKTVDEKAALAVKGVRQVVNIDEAVAVVADHMGAAKKGLEAAAITWDDGPNGKVSNADIVKQLEEESKKPGVVARNDGDAGKALAEAAQRLEAIYQVPFLAHAAMEPMNCTVHLQKDRLRHSGRDTGADAHAVSGGRTHRPAKGCDQNSQSSDWRWLRPKAGGRWHGARRQDRQARRRSGEGDLEPRGRHPARYVSAVLLRSSVGRA